MQARLRSPYVSSRRRESTKLCGGFDIYITSIIMMLIMILLMIEDRCNPSFAKKKACYVHIYFIIGDENGCKTNSVFYLIFCLNINDGAYTEHTHFEISLLSRPAGEILNKSYPIWWPSCISKLPQ